MRRVGGVESWYSQNPYAWVGGPQKGEKLQLQRFSPRGKGSDHTPGSPAQGSCTGKTVLKMFGFEDNWGLFWETQRGKGNRDSTLKGHTQNLTCSGIQGRSSNSKGAYVRPTYSSWRIS